MIDSAIKQFKYYKMLGEKAMQQVSDEVLFYAKNDSDNAVATIVKHLHGNMMSRWTNIFTEDGEKPWRKRDAEFEPLEGGRTAMMEAWEEGWNTVFTALGSLSEEDINRIIYIRNDGMTVSDAIIRQLCHYAYHVGQIVYVCKENSGDSWQSLSIPKNQSQSYNFKKFEEVKAKRHFLDSLMDEGK
ncbi:MAG: DUF1572 family protein [Lewinellaceae bacterium]|nr:DUF1572 family protein [Lewinellaceae bacterium]